MNGFLLTNFGTLVTFAFYQRCPGDHAPPPLFRSILCPSLENAIQIIAAFYRCRTAVIASCCIAAAVAPMDVLRRSLDYALSGSFKRKVTQHAACTMIAFTYECESGCFCRRRFICRRFLHGDLHGAHWVLQDCHEKGEVAALSSTIIAIASLSAAHLVSCITH